MKKEIEKMLTCERRKAKNNVIVFGFLLSPCTQHSHLAANVLALVK